MSGANSGPRKPLAVLSVLVVIACMGSLVPIRQAQPSHAATLSTLPHFAYRLMEHPAVNRGSAYAFAAASDGTTLVLENSDRIVRLDSTGRVIDAFGSIGTGLGQFSTGAAAIAIVDNQYVAVASTYSVHVFTIDGTPLRAWPHPDFHNLKDFEATPAGDLIAVHEIGGKVTITRLSLDGQLLAEWILAGGNAPDIGFLDSVVAPNGRLYVATNWADKIHVYDLDGTLVASWRVPNIQYYVRLAADQDSSIVMSDGWRCTLYRFDGTTGRELRRWGGYGSAPGEFSVVSAVIAILIAPSGDVFASADGMRQIIRYDRDGKYLASYGPSGGELAMIGDDVIVGSRCSDRQFYTAFQLDGTVAFTRPCARGGGYVFSVDVSEEGRVLMVFMDRTVVSDQDGGVLSSFVPAGHDGSQLYGDAAAFGDDGNIWYANNVTQSVEVYRRNGIKISAWPVFLGSDIGFGSIDVVSNQGVWLLWSGSRQISPSEFVSYSMLGRYDFQGTKLWQRELENSWSGVVVDGSGVAYVVESLRSTKEPAGERIASIDSDGRTLAKWFPEGLHESEYWLGGIANTDALHLLRADLGVMAYGSAERSATCDGEQYVFVSWWDRSGSLSERITSCGGTLPVPGSPGFDRRLNQDSASSGDRWFVGTDTGVEVWSTGLVGQWHEQYFASPWPAGDSVLARAPVSAIDYYWGAGAPSAGMPTDGFSALYMNHAEFVAGSHPVAVTYDGGVRFWIGEQLVLDDWHNEGLAEYETTVELPGGHHLMRLEYRDTEGDALLKLAVSPQGTATPTSTATPTATPTPTIVPTATTTPRLGKTLYLPWAGRST